MRTGLLAALALLTGCANLPTTGDGIVALEIAMPASLVLESGSTVQLEARALDRQGQEVVAEIRWRTPDESLAVDSVSGLVTGIAESGVGRVQATVGTLRSDLISFTLRPPTGS